MLDEWQGMSMEVTKRGISSPLPHIANLFRVGATEKESHDPTVAEQASSSFIGIYTAVARNGKGRCTQENGDYNGGHGLTKSAPVQEYVQGCVSTSVVQFYMEDPAHDGAGRAIMYLTVYDVG